MTIQNGTAKTKAEFDFAMQAQGAAWLKAKADEEDAKARRIKAEETIADMVGVQPGDNSGVLSVQAPGYAIKLTPKTTVSIDQEVAREIFTDLPDEQEALVVKYSLNTKGRDAMEQYHPEAAAILALSLIHI